MDEFIAITFREDELRSIRKYTVTLDDVRMTSIAGEVSIGNPIISGAFVTAEVVGQGKDKKIIVFKYKAKTRYRRKKGHRQQYTDLRVTEITS